MKKSFSGYYKDKDLGDVLESSDILIVLDSSVLCNLYGLHDEVWKPILSMLEKKCNCLWLPYSMASNYHRGIFPILVNKIQLLVNLKNKLQRTTDLLNSLPFSFPESQIFKESSNCLSKRLTREIAIIKQRGKKDSAIREAISKLYNGRVGTSNNDPDPKSFRISSYNSEVTEADALSGVSQSVVIPQSTVYDQPKNSDSNDIILHTLIKLSKDKKKDILYVISEPSDYWSVFIGRTSYGPNPEHQSYFNRNTNGQHFYCYTFASFMQKLSACIGETLSEEIKSNLNNLSYGDMLQNDEGDFML